MSSSCPTRSTTWTPWRTVLAFGFVSLAADMVYEGARSMYGPLLAALGASALVVGVVTGAGEAMALVLRLVSGPMADRNGSYWSWTIVGYGLTAVCVPLLAVTPLIGGAGLALAIVLILAERAGKAVRSPSKSALLAHAAAAVGRGRGFGIHKALDQVGAFAGPLLVAGVLAVAGTISPAMAVLAVPGVVAMVLLAVIRRAVPDPSVFDESAQPRPETAQSTGAAPARGLRGWWADVVGADLPRSFFGFAAAAGLTTAGLVTFGVISFHLVTRQLVSTAQVPLVYAGAMLVEAVAALAVGALYDRFGGRVLYGLPLLVAVVPATALTGSLVLALTGVAVWAVATGLQDSTVKALVAELVPGHRRATAYGVFAAIQGAMAIVGGAVAGGLYERSLPALVAVIAVSQLGAVVLLWRVLRRHG